MDTPAVSQQRVTELLTRWSQGDDAALAELTPLIYEELRRLAHHQMGGQRPDHTLQTTALVNEAYLRLVDWKNVEWQNRAHFFGVASQIMRRILVDYARAQHRAKRGGEALQVSLSQAAGLPVARVTDVVALDEALAALETLSARQSRVVELRYFGGLSLEETAEVLNVSVGTVRRDWSLARAWLYRELTARGDA